MKKLVSLLLALTLCLSLSVPALAYSSETVRMSFHGGIDVSDAANGEGGSSGDGWKLIENGDNGPVLQLSGAQNLSVWLHGTCTIELVPGTKSTLLAPVCVEDPNDDGSMPVLTIRGGGELEIISNGNGNAYMTDYFFQEAGAFSGCFSEVKFENGLKITGGAKKGDNSPLTLGAKFDEHDDGWALRAFSANGKAAQYVHIGPAAEPSATGFSDVADSSPYAEAIKWAVDQKITTGITATAFGPGNTCTVSHILTFLWRANGRPGESGTERESVAAWADGLGIDTTNLGGSCTRAAAVTYMWKAAGSPEPAKAASFTDVPANASYAKAVSWAVEKGITSGTSATAFSPDKACTRGQIVTFLYRASK